MRERFEQLKSALGRTDMELTLIFAILYGVWIAWPVYGSLPFSGYLLLTLLSYSKKQGGLKKLTNEVQKNFPEKLSEERWALLKRYGLAIYTQKAAEPLAFAFKWCMLLGYCACIVLALMQRWIDVLACFSISMLALHMQRQLEPDKYFERLAKKNPEEYAPKVKAIRELRDWVHSEEAP